ncbi:MAG: hypothetical protein IJ588_01670 [Prevotella sp.]|nr:hypothetical protein [Prevotella sp.]
MNIKKTTLRLTAIVMLLLATTSSIAQQKTTMAMLYRQFKPAVITLTDGRVITNPLTNVFLKNSSLLYLHNTYTMEAKMETISKVEFEDQKFVVINNQLASIVDTIGSNVLFRIDYLDMDAYKAQLKNNIQITNLTLSDFVNTDAVDLNNEEDYKFPLVHKYYMLYNGEMIQVHEREIWRKLPKDKDIRRQYKTIISLPDFTWVDDESIIKLLKAISN